MLRLQVISGGQTGVDQAALRAARKCGLTTGGWAPYGYQTLDGPDESLRDYGLQECAQPGYPPRTRLNVRGADATLRLAANFSTSGERCTLQAIKDSKKLHLDVARRQPLLAVDVAGWIMAVAPPDRDMVLNVAGNSEDNSPGIGAWAESYLTEVFEHVQKLRLAGLG